MNVQKYTDLGKINCLLKQKYKNLLGGCNITLFWTSGKFIVVKKSFRLYHRLNFFLIKLQIAKKFIKHSMFFNKKL